MEMLEETYTKFKKYILPKQKRQNPDFQEPVIQSNNADEVIDICSYNHYPVIEKETAGSTCDNFINDVYVARQIGGGPFSYKLPPKLAISRNMAGIGTSTQQ